MPKKTKDRIVKWHGHVMRREYKCLDERMVKMDVRRKRMKGRPKRRWKDGVMSNSRE